MEVFFYRKKAIFLGKKSLVFRQKSECLATKRVGLEKVRLCFVHTAVRQDAAHGAGLCFLLKWVGVDCWKPKKILDAATEVKIQDLMRYLNMFLSNCIVKRWSMSTVCFPVRVTLFLYYFSFSLIFWLSKMTSASGSRRKAWWECPAKQVRSSSSWWCGSFLPGIRNSFPSISEEKNLFSKLFLSCRNPSHWWPLFVLQSCGDASVPSWFFSICLMSRPASLSSYLLVSAPSLK